MAIRSWVGLDVGTSALKGVVIDESGHQLAAAKAEYETLRPEPGAAEQDPQDWLSAARTVLATLSRQTTPADWQGIGLCAMLPTLVTVDEAGTPVGSALTWQDARADAWGEQLRQEAPQIEQTTGQRIDGRYLLPMALRLAAVDPDRYARTATLLSCKDYVFSWLTGHVLTDPTTAAGVGCFDLAANAWDPALLGAAARLAAAPIPRLPNVAATTTTRPLRMALAESLGVPNVPVCLGVADSVAGAVGVGAMAPNDVAYIAGTSTAILGLSTQLSTPEHRPFLVTPMHEPELWGYELDILSTGSALAWLASVLGVEGGVAELVDLGVAEGVEDAPVVLPYLAPGEQGALWEPRLAGRIDGLHLGTTRAAIVRGLLNGLIVESRRCLDALLDVGVDGPVTACGSMLSDPRLRQDLSDAIARPVTYATGSSAVGAARLACRAVAGASLPTVSGSLSRTEPDPARRGAWDSVMRRHNQVLRSSLAELEREGDPDER